LENKLINYETYFVEMEKACDLSDEKECEIRLDLLRNIQMLYWNGKPIYGNMITNSSAKS